ncbi:MAG: hypothetical protein ACRC3H_12240, partial [Lachnospiraceae bacterium]
MATEEQVNTLASESSAPNWIERRFADVGNLIESQAESGNQGAKNVMLLFDSDYRKKVIDDANANREYKLAHLADQKEQMAYNREQRARNLALMKEQDEERTAMKPVREQQIKAAQFAAELQEKQMEEQKEQNAFDQTMVGFAAQNGTEITSK